MCKKGLISLFLLISSSYSTASTYESGSFTVSQLRIATSGVFLTLSPAPTGCNGGTQYGSHFLVDSSNETNYQMMVSGLLAAYTANTKLSGVWFNNEGTCSNSHILNLYMYKFEAK